MAGYIKGKPDVSWWMTQIRNGIQYRKKHAMEQHWEKWRAYYQNKFDPRVIPVNLFFRMVRTTVPRVYFRNPSISVSPTKPGLEQMAFARLIQRLDNRLIRTMRVKQQMKAIVQNAWFFGTAFGKRGFASEFAFAPSDLEEQEQPLTSGGNRVEYNASIQDGMPWFLSAHPGSIVLPDGCTSFEECRWVATKVMRPIDDVKNDKRLKNTSGLQGTSSSMSEQKRAWGLEGRPDMVELYEVRDMQHRRVFVIAPYHTDRLLYDAGDGNDTLFVNNRPPIYSCVFNPVDDCVWGLPDSTILEPQQLEINETRTLQMKHRRLSIVKLLVKNNTISDDEAAKLLTGEVAVVKVAGEIVDIDKLVVGDIPSSLFMYDQTIMADVRDGMGFSRNQAGEYAGGGKSHGAPTAAEVAEVREGAEIRVDERRDILADMLVDMFEDTNVTLFENWNDEQVVDITGPDGLPIWVAFKPAMLKAARYELLIDPDSSVPETKQTRMNRALALYRELKQNPLIGPEQLTQYLLHELHGVQFDSMMRTMQQIAPGGGGMSRENPMNFQQFMQTLVKNPKMREGVTGGGA